MPPVPPTILAEVPAVPESVGSLRHAAGELAERCGADEKLVEAVTLAVSEAATNAVIHAYRDEPGRLSLAAESTNGSLWFCVIDEGEGLIPRPDSPGLGLGLPLIARLTTSFEVRPGPSGRGTELAMAFPIAS
jgi:anti-sigma regulatory factor (Ser/Thr protein kinase)